MRIDDDDDDDDVCPACYGDLWIWMMTYDDLW